MSLLTSLKKLVSGALAEANAPQPQLPPDYVTSGFTPELAPAHQGLFLAHPGRNRKERRRLQAQLRASNPVHKVTRNGWRPAVLQISKTKTLDILKNEPKNFPIRRLSFNLEPNKRSYCLEPMRESLESQYAEYVRTFNEKLTAPTNAELTPAT